MPHKDKKEHAQYQKKYYKNPVHKEKNRQLQRLVYWRHKLEDYYFRHEIGKDIYDIKNKSVEQLKEICYSLGISEKKEVVKK